MKYLSHDDFEVAYFEDAGTWWIECFAPSGSFARTSVADERRDRMLPLQREVPYLMREGCDRPFASEVELIEFIKQRFSLLDTSAQG